jgi:hypothetical protein
MDERRKDVVNEPLKSADGRDGQAAKERGRWQRPQWRKLDAGEAETNFHAGPDYGIVS